MEKTENVIIALAGAEANENAVKTAHIHASGTSRLRAIVPDDGN